MDRPFFHLHSPSAQNDNSSLSVLCVIEGEDCMSTNDLFTALKTALSLPDYLHVNWDSLLDCLIGIQLAQNSVLVINCVDSMLENIGEEDFSSFMSVLKDLSKELLAPDPDFSVGDEGYEAPIRLEHILNCSSEDGLKKVEDVLKRAQIEITL